MGDAFAEARASPGRKDRDDKLTELVARQIVELAEPGVQTKTVLRLMTVQKFKDSPQ